MSKTNTILKSLLGAAAVWLAASGAGWAQTFTGDFTSGGAVYTNDADLYDAMQARSGIAVAVDTITAGGPFVYTVSVSSTGNMYPTGSNSAYLIVKYNPSGVEISSVSFPMGAMASERPSITVGPGGAIYVAGTIPEVPFTGNSPFDALVLKYTKDLTYVSSATFRAIAPGNMDSFLAIAADATGVYAAGTSNTDGVGLNYDGAVTVVKYTPNLTQVAVASTSWGLFVGNGLSEIGNGIALSSSGVYVTGPVNTVPNSATVCGVFRFGFNLNFISSASLTGVTTCKAAAAGPGGVYVTGYRDNGNFTYDAVSARYDGQLNFLSSASFAGGGYGMGEGVAVAKDGSVYVSGVAMTANEDFMLLKYDPGLNLVSSFSYITASSDYGYGVALDGSDRAYAALYTGDYFGIVQQRLHRYAITPAPVFSGNFSSPAGAFYDGGGYDGAETVAVDTFTAGGPYVYAAGKSFNPATGLEEAVLIKYDNLGNKLASDRVAGPLNGGFKALKVLSDGSVVAAGYSPERSGVILRRYSSAFSLLVSTNYPANDIFSLDSGSGFVYAVGSAGSFGNGWQLFRLTLTLQPSFSFSLDDTGDANDFASGVRVRPDGAVLVTGGVNSGSLQQWHARVYDSTLSTLLSSGTYNVNLPTNTYVTSWPAMGPAGDYYLVGAYPHGVDSDGLIVHFAPDHTPLHTYRLGSVNSGIYTRPAIDALGNLVVGAYGDAPAAPPYWVNKFSPALTVISTVSTPYLGVASALDASGNTYVASAENFTNEYDPLNNFHTLKVNTSGATLGFNGDFTGPGGSNYDSGLFDKGQAAEVYGGDVFVAGRTGGVDALLVKYNSSGAVLSSAVLAGIEFTGLKVNPNGVYLSAQGLGTGFMVARYDLNTLGFISSATLAGDTSARDLALDAAGNVYLAGSNWGEAGSLNDYKVAKFSPALTFLSSAAYNAGGQDEGRGIAIYDNYLYLTGTSLQGNATHFVTVKFFANTLGYAGFFNDYPGASYLDAAHPAGGKIDVSAGGQDIYVVASASDRSILTMRYDAALSLVSTKTFDSAVYAQGVDVRVTSSSEVFVLGGYNSGLSDYPLVVKYDKDLVFKSSAAVQHNYGFEPAALGVDTYGSPQPVYVTGVYFANGSPSQNDWNMRTVKFAPLGDGGAVLRQISGTANYGGAYDPMAVLTVWVSSSMDYRGTRYETHVPGFSMNTPFTITGVPPGVYYMALTAGQGMVAYSTEPWGVHGQLGTPTPIDVTAGDVSAISVTLTDGNVMPNPFSAAGQAPAWVDCSLPFASGGNCRVNGTSSYGTSVYAASTSTYLLATNLTHSAIVRFDASGAVVSSVTAKYVTFNDIKLNPVTGHLYVAAQGPGSGVQIYRYNQDLVFVSSFSTAGYQGARQLDFDTSGNVYVVSTVDSGGANGADVRIIRIGSDLPLSYAEAIYPSPGPDQGLGIRVDGSDVFVAAKLHPGSVDEAAVLRFNLALTYSGDGATATAAPQFYAEGQGFNYFRLLTDPTDVYLGFSTNLNISTGAAVYRFTRTNLANGGYSSATVMGAAGFGAFAVDGTDFFVAGRGAGNQPRIVRMQLGSLSEVAGFNINVTGLGYGMDPGALSVSGGYGYLGGVMPSGGPLLGAGVAKFDLNGAQAGVEGSTSFDAMPDGSGGAYQLYDSTTAADGLRRFFVRRVSAAGTQLWQQPASGTFYSMPGGEDIAYLAPDGAGGVLAAWTQGGTPFAQRYDSAGTLQWTAGGVVMSTGAALGAKFQATGDGGLGAIIIYDGGGSSLATVLQKMNGSGQCLWPSGTAAACFFSAGTAIPFTSPIGDASLAEGPAGSLWALWSADNGSGRLEVNAARAAAGGGFAVNPKVLATDLTFDLGKSVYGLDTGDGGVYAVWTSSENTQMKLHSRRFLADGNPHAGWSSALQLTGYLYNNYADVELARDPEGFAVMYSTTGSNNVASEVRVVRSSAAAGQLAPGWALGGLLLGRTIDGLGGLVFDGSVYHMDWNQWAAGLPPGNYHRVDYQKMTPDGQLAFSPSYAVGLSSNCLNMAVSTNGAGGALVSWMDRTGGTVLPVQVNISSAAGAFPTLPSYSGTFALPGGAAFSGPGPDQATDAAYYNGSVYVVGYSSVSGGVLIKYDQAGNKLLSVANPAYPFMGVAVNDNGVYVAAQSSGTGFVTLKYDAGFSLAASTTLAGDSSARKIALDAAGNVYVIGSNWGEAGGNKDYKLVKYDPNLLPLVGPVLYDAGGDDEGRDIAVSSGNVYVTGGSVVAGPAYKYVTALFDTGLNQIGGTAAELANAYLAAPNTVRLAVNPASGDVYLGGTQGTETSRRPVLARYNSALAAKELVTFDNGQYGLGFDVAVDTRGFVYALVKDMTLAADRAALLRLTPSLVLVSSAVTPDLGVNFYGMGLALNPLDGYAYAAGFTDNAGDTDIHTVRFAPLPVPHPRAAGEIPLSLTDLGDTGISSAFGAGVFMTGYQYDGHYIAARPVSAAGAPGAELRLDPVADYASGGAPAVASNGADFLLVWNTDAPGYSNYIRAQRVSSAGAKIGASFWISQQAGPLDGAASDGSGYLVVWSSGPGTGIRALRAQRVSAAGALVGQPLDITENGSARESRRAAAFGSGRYLVAWTQDDNDAVVMGRFVNPDGSFGGGEFVVDASTMPSDNPVTVAASHVGYLVAFHDLTGADYGVYGKPVAYDGAVAASTFAFSAAAGGKSYSDVSWDGSRYLAAWTEAPHTGGASVHMRYYDHAGAPLGPDTALAYAVDGWAPFAAGLAQDGAGNTLALLNREKAPGNSGETTDLYRLLLSTNAAPALVPTVTLSTANAAPGNYFGQQEAPALKLDLRTAAGRTAINGIRVHVNPGRPYADVAAVGLYADDGNGVWTRQDTFIASAPVAGQFATLGFPPGTLVDTMPGVVFLTLTPAAGSVGASVNLAVDVATHVFTAGTVAAQAIYPAVSPATPVNLFAPIASLAQAAPGASLTSVSLTWTYPQAVPPGSHVVVDFSTDTADLSLPPESPSYVVALATGAVAGSVGAWTSPDLTPVTAGLRVFPQYFAAWIYNGLSTSAASNLAQNLYFPVAATPDGSAVLRQRAGMTAHEARVARSPDGLQTLTAVTFDSVARYVMLRSALGGQFFYNDAGDPALLVKRLAADNGGDAYLLADTQAGPKVIKIAPDGAVAWSSAPFAGGETPKAILYGGSAVYLAAEVAGTATDIKLFKLDPVTGGTLYSTVYNFAAGSDDYVNSIAFTSDASGAAYIYAAGVSDGSAIVHKFYDNGAGFLPQTGNWPLRHANPSGDSSEALVVKADPNANLVVAGTELRNDLNQYKNVWVNKFNQFGVQMFAAPGRYNNPQANSDDVPAAIDFDSYGGIHVAGYSDMTPLGRGKDLLLARFGASGQPMSAGVYGGPDDDYATGVAASSDSYVNAAGLFGLDGVYGVYSAPLGAGGAAAQFFSAVEGAYTGSVDLVWNYTGALPSGSTFYVQASSAAAPAWNRLAAQYAVNPPAQGPGAVQAFTVGALTTLRYPGQPPAETRGLPYQFKVWIASAGLVTELPAAQSYARTPSAYDNTQYFGSERLSFMSGLSQPHSAVAADGQYVYHAFAGYADGANAGFGLRKYDTGKYLEWTKFFNHSQDRAYYVGAMTRDAAGNFYIVGSQSPSAPSGIPYMSPAKDLWIAKLDAEGELLWSYSRDEGLGGKDELNAAALEGNYLYVAGIASDTVNGLAAFAAKYDISPATGPVRVWTSKLNGSGAGGYDEAYGVAVGTAVFVSGTLQNATKDAFIATLNKADGQSAGGVIAYDSGYGDSGYGLALTTATPPYLYLGGSMGRWDLVGTPHETHDAMLRQYTPDGALVSTSAYGGKDNIVAGVYTVKADATGVIVAGYEGTGAFGQNSVYRKFAHGAGPLDERIMWSRSFDFGAGGDDAADGLDTDAAGRVYSAVMLHILNPGFYYFPEPSFSVTAAPSYVPGSVRLEWMTEAYLPGGTTFYVQYSTFGAGTAWSAFSAQSVTNAAADIWVGANMSRVIYGLNTGRDAAGGSIAPQYYFKVWYSTPGAVSPVPVSPAAAAARPSEGWAFESMSVYPNDAKLFVMGDYRPPYYGGDEMEFAGVARDPNGSLYTLANMDWNGSQGFAVKKFTSAMQPVWTRYYAPGEWYEVRANKMTADAAGNLYITGYERAPGSVTGRDLFFMKLGPAGTVWKTVVDFAGGNDAGYGVALDAAGNGYVAGAVYAGPANDEDAFVAKFGPGGAVISSVTYNGTAALSDDAAYSVAVQGGNLYAAGTAEMSGKGSQFWMARYDNGPASLTSPLTATLGDDDGGAFDEAAFGVAIATHGAVYFAGQLYSPDNGSLDAAVVKTSADFTTEWAQRYNSQANGADSVRAVALDLSGAAFAAGYTERYDINQDKNLWLRKFAPDGSELLTQEFNANAIQGGDAYAQGPSSDEGFSIAVGTMGYVSVGGRFGGYYGLYRYKQTNLLTVNPVLTVAVSSGAAGTPFPGVGVTLIPFSPTGGIDISGSTSAVTGPSGSAAFTVPAGKQYFIALDKQGFNPAIRDQLMDPYGSYFVQPNADLTRNYTLTARSAADPYYPLTVRISSAAQRDFVMAEVFFTATGEKAAYGVAQVPAGQSSATITVSNLPPASAGAYTLGVTIPARGLARSVAMNGAFPSGSVYSVVMSTMAGAVATTGGFDVGASTTPASVEGVVRSTITLAPVEQARVMLYNEGCRNSPCAFNSYETLSDVNGKFAFYGVAPSTVAYNLSAQKANYKRGSLSNVYVTTASASAGFREFQLEKATYTLRGYIRYRDLPVPNADVMVNGDYTAYGAGADSYRPGRGMDADARTKTGADGSFVFSTATANGLPDGQVRMVVSFMGNWMELNKGNKQSASLDSDYVRIVISSQGATGAGGNCSKGRVWKLSAQTGACQSLANGEVNFNLMPQSQNDYALLSGSVTFVTTYTVTPGFPLVISTAAPITVMAMQDCSNCSNKSMGFAVISGTYTVSYATYSITLSTGVSYYTRVTSNEWGEVSSFDDRADFTSTMTTSVRMNFVVTKAGRLSGVVKLPDGANYKPVYGTGMSDTARHKLDVEVRGQNVSVNEGWSVDDYGAFEFPNLAPGLYTVSLRPEGEAFRWAAPTVSNLSVVAGKTTQVTLKLENGLYVQPQIIGLPEISTPAWSYVMIPVPSGTEMNQKRITDMFFGDNTFAFSYSTATQTWEKKIMQVGQYDFYLMMGAQYNPEGEGGRQLSYDQFGNFIGKVKGFNVQRNDATPNLGTEAQPIPVNVLGSLGQDTFEGTIAGSQLYTDADIARFFANMNELFAVIPAVMVYDAAGDLRGYTAGLPSRDDFPAFENAMGEQDLAGMRTYLDAHLGRFMVAGMPPGRYTVVFNNPNYPPVAKEVTLPLAAGYAFSFDEQRIRVGAVYGTVRSTATGEALPNAVVYLKHKTVEKFAATNADGVFRFDNMPQGIYRLEVTREGFVKAGEKTTLAGDDSARLDFWLHPSQTSMTGKVYMSKFPSPVTKSGVKIVAYDETFNTEHPTEYLPKIEATTNDSGEYELSGVVPGHNYKVTAFHGGKQTFTLDVGSETVTEGTTYLPDIVMRDVPPQIVVKVRKSPDSVNKADVTIKSPKMLVTTPVCKINPGEAYVATSAVSLALVPGPNNTYEGQFTISRSQPYYNVYVAAGDGSSRMEKSVTFSPNNAAKTEQYIQDEAIQGGEVQMDRETEEYSGLELDAGGLAYSSGGGASALSYGASANGGLVGGFFSSLPSVRTVKTAKGDLSLTQAITDLMASEVYNMELQNASANKPFTLTLKYDKEKAADGANLRIYQYDETTGGWNEVPGNYTTDPMLGVLAVDVANLTNAAEGVSAALTPLGRKRYGMSAVVNGRYVPSAASSSQSGRFAVFTARPSPNVAYAGADYEVANLPNPFNLKDKTVTNLEGTAAFSGATTYTTRGTLIKYHLPPGKSGSVKFVIYNLAGEKVRTVSDGVRAGGNMYYSEWDGRNDNNQDVASGVYFMLTYVDGTKIGAKAHKLAVIK